MLDPITEAISHFIGYFHLSTEEMRMRMSYDQFRLQKAEKDEIKAQEPKPGETPSFDLEGYNPDLNWKPRFKDDRFSSDPYERPWPDETPEVPKIGPLPDLPQVFLPPVPDFAVDVPAPAPPEFTLPPPSSIATVTLQTAVLHDDDVFGDVEGSGFAAPETFAPRLDHLTQVAHGLSAIKLPQPDGETPWVGATKALRTQIEAAADGAGSLPAGAEVFTGTGSKASGVLVNGQAAEALPTLADAMPAFFKDTTPEADDLSGDLPEGYEAPEPQPSGHTVVAGANAAVNETQVDTVWLDARMIVVRGDVTQIAAISQVNVLSDRDDLGSQTAPDLPSDLLNAASIERISTPAGAVSADLSGTFPLNWVITRIDGDLISCNWVTQTTYATDHDMAVVTSMGTNTYIGLGGNEIVNTTLIGEIGFRYDLIVVGGNLYDISAIYQCNVLLDDDLVVGGADASGGDNLLFNSASIGATGVDTFGKLTAPTKAAIDALAKGDDAMPSALAQDALFEGIGYLNVLYISGDFVKMNVVKQVNVLGDNDQIELAAEAAMLAVGKGVTVVTGSNMLANTAAIQDHGIDSTVMAGGGIYTDALIHQAGFVDPGAPPTGVAQPGLASEAVAFLADDMIDAPAVSDSGGPAPLPMDGDSLDVMQTMLA